MHLSILSELQQQQLPLLKSFKASFVLAGGTAIALQTVHRKSIDFDCFSFVPLRKDRILKKLSSAGSYQLIYQDAQQLDVLLQGVKWTFLHYPFAVYQHTNDTVWCRMPNLLTLAAMKAYAIGRRAKWKDYVDLYVLMTHHFSLANISQQATIIFGDAFSEKLFRQQLVWFAEMDYSEPIDWVWQAIPNETIQQALIDYAMI